MHVGGGVIGIPSLSLSLSGMVLHIQMSQSHPNILPLLQQLHTQSRFQHMNECVL